MGQYVWSIDEYISSKTSMVFQCVGCRSLAFQPLGLVRENGKYGFAHGPTVSEKCEHCRSNQNVSKRFAQLMEVFYAELEFEFMSFTDRRSYLDRYYPWKKFCKINARATTCNALVFRNTRSNWSEINLGRNRPSFTFINALGFGFGRDFWIWY